MTHLCIWLSAKKNLFLEAVDLVTACQAKRGRVLSNVFF